MRIFFKKISAYSLLEVAIAIMVSGVAISSILPLLKTISMAKQARINEAKYHYIRNSMQGYLLRYGYLPFAANSDDGIEKKNLIRGIIPYKSLGIAKEYIYDSNNKFFTYIVNKNLALQENKEYIPIIRSSHTLGKNQITFCRLYKNDKTLIMDEICTLENLIISEKGISIITPKDSFFIMDPMPFFNTAAEYHRWQAQAVSGNSTKQKSCNTIAWLIISHGANKKNKKISKCKEMNNIELQKVCILPENNDNGLFNDIIFYQTRFDMAAQMGYPCTSEPILIT